VRITTVVGAGAVALAAATSGVAQQTPPAVTPLAVGAVAPDFTVTGATRYGVLARSLHLSDFKGKTVVLAFFFKARTKG
jgi:peroxiredoxin Q/BCP